MSEVAGSDSKFFGFFRGRIAQPHNANYLKVVESKIPIPGIAKKFTVKDNFVLNDDPKAGLKLLRTCSSFKDWFDEQVLPARGEYFVKSVILQKPLLDREILSGLEYRHETDLAAVFHLLNAQFDGRKGTLQVGGKPNNFYIKDVDGVLRVVSVYWGLGGWGINAFSVDEPDMWDHRIKVISLDM